MYLKRIYLGASRLARLTKYYSGDRFMEDEMGGAFDTVCGN